MEDNKTISKPQLFKYPDMTKTLGPFKLSVTGGQFTTSEITVLLGQNGTGKTTFIKMLAGITKPDQEDIYIDELSISYKP
jgi:ATP-binding cassette subfamily E protein 1